MKAKMILAALVLTLGSTPVTAGYKLMATGKPVAVAKSGLTVTPSIDWNRLGARPGRNAESWTLDGLTLNDLTFYGGIADNTTLFRDANKKDSPLPRFSKTMLAPDIAQLFEGSYRVANGTALMTIDSIEPARFADNSGFRFAYTFTRQGEEVKRKGEGRGAVINSKLYMITFEAPVIHYYEKGLPAFRAIADGAKLGAAPAK